MNLPVLGFAWLLASAAQAAINISTQATQNMSCSGGVCTATAQKAYLNVNDVTTMLAAGDLKVVSGAGAEDIHIQAPFSWTSTSRLTLDAQRSIEFEKPVSAAGTGALTLLTNDGDTGGDYWFDEGASVSFWDTASSLVINGQPFILVKDLTTLGSDIASNIAGAFALARSYNAAKDGIYSQPPVTTTFQGRFEGLGNTVRNLTIRNDNADWGAALFQWLDGATVRDVALSNMDFQGRSVAGIAIRADGPTILHSHTSGNLEGRQYGGGLVGLLEDGEILRSYSTAVITARENGFAGGLVGSAVGGTISESWASGSIRTGRTAGQDPNASAGGLVGYLYEAQITNSYALGDAEGGRASDRGGLAGFALRSTKAWIYSSYSTGDIGMRPGGYRGGLLGEAWHDYMYLENTYWDLDTSGIDDPSQGVGNVPNEVGITGITDIQLRSGLPMGFGSPIWRQNPNINNGYPYLRFNPPPKGNKAITHPRPGANHAH